MPNPRIEETLNALNGINRAAPRAGLFDEVMARVDGLSKSYEQVKSTNVWLAAASFALLLGLNVGAWLFIGTSTEQAAAQSLATEYNLHAGSDNYLTYR